MLCRWIGKSLSLVRHLLSHEYRAYYAFTLPKHLATHLISLTSFSRYEITNNDAPTWQEAERQIRTGASTGAKSTVVSVKSKAAKTGDKRKVVETAAQIYEKELGGLEEGRNKKKEKKRR